MKKKIIILSLFFLISLSFFVSAQECKQSFERIDSQIDVCCDNLVVDKLDLKLEGPSQGCYSASGICDARCAPVQEISDNSYLGLFILIALPFWFGLVLWMIFISTSSLYACFNAYSRKNSNTSFFQKAWQSFWILFLAFWGFETGYSKEIMPWIKKFRITVIIFIISAILTFYANELWFI